MSAHNPRDSDLHNLTEKALLVKILSELRVQTLLLSQANAGNADDIGALRAEVMSGGNKSQSDV